MTPSIDEIVSLLARDAPTRLSELRNRFPDANELLREGIVAGDVELAAEDLVRKEAAASALEVAAASYARLLSLVNARIREARRLALWGQIATVIAGATIVANAATVFPVAVKVGCGLLALAASLLGVVAQARLTPDGDQQGSLYAMYRRLIEAGVIVQSLSLELQLSPPENRKSLATFVGQVNVACRRLNEVAPHLNDLKGG